MDYVLRRLLRAGMKRGRQGDWTWFALAGAAYVLRRVLSAPRGKVSTVTVEPGETVLISVRDAKSPAGSGAGVLAAVGAGAGNDDLG